MNERLKKFSLGEVELAISDGYELSDNAKELIRKLAINIAMFEMGDASGGFRLEAKWQKPAPGVAEPTLWEYSHWCDDSMGFSAEWRGKTFPELLAKINQDGLEEGEVYDGDWDTEASEQ